jgi:hypothetical protein
MNAFASALVEIPARPSQTYWNSGMVIGGRWTLGDPGRDANGEAGQDMLKCAGCAVTETGCGTARVEDVRGGEVDAGELGMDWTDESRGGMTKPGGRWVRGRRARARYVARRIAWMAGP